MIENCDVAVIGLGPAGASAALAAAVNGAKVMAFDRKREAGFPVQCAEFVPMMLGVDSGPVGAALVQPIDAMESYIDGAMDRLNTDFRGRMIDRATFDAELVTQAQAAGATVSFGAQIDAIGGDGVVTLNDGRAIAARVLIGADGPRSRVGASIGSINDHIVETRQVCVPLLQPHQATDIFLSARMPGGYAWMFPKGEVANVGLGVDRRWRDRLKPELDDLLDLLVDRGTIARRIISHTGGAIPVGGPLQVTGRIGHTQVVLVGDAAGLTNPVTGAGIPAACHSGRMAGEAAARYIDRDTDAFCEYAEDIEDLFGASLRRAVTRRNEVIRFFDDGQPTQDQLRRGWIAYPEYWSAL